MKIERYQAYKDSDVAWLGDVPEHWGIYRAKDTVKRIGNGVTPRGGSEVYTESGVPFLRSQNVYDDGLRIENVSFIPMEIHNEMRNSQLKAGDILINITGASIGRTCIVPVNLGAANINQHIAFLRIKTWFNAAYISLFLKSHFIKKYIQIEQNGASKEAFNLNQIANIPLVLPPLEEQKAIARYLDTKTAQIDRKIDLLTQKATLYSNLKQSLINETVTRGLDKTAPMKDSGIELLGKIPVHWTMTKLSKTLKKITNGYVGSTREIMRENGIPYIQGIHIKNYSIKFTPDGNYYVDREWSKSHPKSILKENDILVVQTGSIGEVGIVPKEFEGANCHALLILRTISSKFIPKYLLYLLASQYGFISLHKIATGGILLHINGSKLKGVDVFLPPLEEQRTIADYLDTKTAQIDQIIQTINTQIEKLKELRKTLINDVVTGKIKVV